MNHLLNTIERQLVTGIARDAARRRRARRCTIAGTAATVTIAVAGVGIAANVGSPVERMVHQPDRGRPSFGIAENAPREDVRVTDPGGLSWTVATYLARNGALTTTQAPDGLRGFPGGGGAAPFVIADNLLESGPAGDEGSLQTVVKNGRQHYLFSGAVVLGERPPTVEHVDIDIAGTTSRATLAGRPITLRVPIDEAGLTHEGRERVERFPKSVTILPYAATFPPDTFEKTTGRARITATFGDGRRITYRAHQDACGRRGCGHDALTVP